MSLNWRETGLAMWLGLTTQSTVSVMDWILRLREEVGVPHMPAGLNTDGARIDDGRRSGQVRSGGAARQFSRRGSTASFSPPAARKASMARQDPLALAPHCLAGAGAYRLFLSPAGLTNDSLLAEDGGERAGNELAAGQVRGGGERAGTAARRPAAPLTLPKNVPVVL